MLHFQTKAIRIVEFRDQRGQKNRKEGREEGTVKCHTEERLCSALKNVKTIWGAQASTYKKIQLK